MSIHATAATLVALAALVGPSPAANASDVVAAMTTQTRCGTHHHVQKRTVTVYYNTDGTVAAPMRYGPWVRKARSC